MDEKQKAVAALLEELQAGDQGAVDQLFAILYDELKDLAGRQRRRWHGNYTLNTTALVHEAYVKLMGRAEVAVETRAHFGALAARVMRHVLCDYARDQSTQRRGGGLRQLQLEELWMLPDQSGLSEEHSATLIALDDALERLEQINPRQSKVVECRFFGGLTIDETAAAIGASARTVKRDWAMAQAWLHNEMDPQG